MALVSFQDVELGCHPEPRKTAKDLTLALKLHKPKGGLFEASASWIAKAFLA